jgi:hypothetical protein
MSENEPNEAQKPFQRAYEEFRDAAQAAWQSDEVKQKFDDTYREFVRAATEAVSAGSSAGYMTACFDYGNRIREAAPPEETARKISAAYDSFLAATRDAFANADAATLTPQLLWKIGQGLAEVATMAASAAPRPL